MNFKEVVSVDRGTLEVNITSENQSEKFTAYLGWNITLDKQGNEAWEEMNMRASVDGDYYRGGLSPSKPKQLRRAAAFFLLVSECYEKGPDYWLEVFQAEAKAKAEAAERERLALEEARAEGEAQAQQR